jgi:Flp pilus assembly protein TadG
MNKIRNYWKNKKGITLVWGAFFLVLILMLAGMAIDIGYMYVVKNQLQVAADSACLAGVTQLDGTNSVDQGDARTTTVIFGGKNSAAGSSVVLASDGSNSLTDSNDITVGNWAPANDPKYLAGRFPINAVEVRARRSANSPGGPVSVFFGKIFRMIGADWSLMNASATATCTMPPRASSYISVGSTFCPPVGSPLCVGLTGSTFPTICTFSTPRVVDAGPSGDPSTKFAWTTLLLPPASATGFNNLICNTSPNQDVCYKEISTSMGTVSNTLRNYEATMFDPTFDVSSKDIVSGRVTGWWFIIPQTDQPLPGTGGWTLQTVIGYVKAHIKTVCAPGGGSPCRSYASPSDSSPNDCSLYSFSGGSGGFVIDQISCIACETPGGGLKPALVK